jgi:hypothetical protein
MIRRSKQEIGQLTETQDRNLSPGIEGKSGICHCVLLGELLPFLAVGQNKQLD